MRRVCSWQENANCTCYRHLVGSWNLNQSRAEVLPVGRSRVAGEEREGEPRSNTQSSTPSPGQEQKMSHCAKWSKAQNHSFRQAKPFWFSEGILVGMGQHRLMTRLFAKKSWKFTRNLHEESRKNLETICKHRRRFREFGAISGTYQKSPCLKPWAIAKDFGTKSANFGPLRIRPKSTRTIPQAVRNPFASIGDLSGSLERFLALTKIRHVQNHGLNLQALMAQAFCSRLANFGTLLNSHQLFTKNLACSWNSICKHVGDVFREFGMISGTYQNPPSSIPWATTRPFAQNRPISDPWKLCPNLHEQCRTQLKIHLQACWRCS